MANLGQTFDANNVAPTTPMEVIPAGKYNVHIVNSEMRDTKTGGQMLWLEMDILDGQFAGRKLWDRLNLVNQNTQAVEIAQRTLSAICHATGQMTVTDSEQLHFKPMLATVKVRPAGPDKFGTHREAQNEVRGYEGGASAGSTARPASNPAQTAGRPAAQTQASKPASAPWRRTAA
ncbi:DUF669 domain-containing protein [Roseomonas mucosa]|uniref:DUF669 domain-containing protein n=1 Tax=Roseomonas mucosa TaxID=207340 RepID=UPI0030D54100